MGIGNAFSALLNKLSGKPQKPRFTSAVILAGGTLEISTAIKGYAFVNSDYDFSEITPSVPDTSFCRGKYMMVASYDSEGGYATTYDPSASEYYKYVKFVYGVYDSGITVAQNVDDRVVCVNITSENFMDVFGDGTVSFDPDTYTLTLNGYQYKGDFYGIYSMLPSVPSSLASATCAASGSPMSFSFFSTM